MDIDRYIVTVDISLSEPFRHNNLQALFEPFLKRQIETSYSSKMGCNESRDSGNRSSKGGTARKIDSTKEAIQFGKDFVDAFEILYDKAKEREKREEESESRKKNSGKDGTSKPGKRKDGSRRNRR